MRLGELRETGLEFVLDYCPDLVVTHVMDNDIDSSSSVVIVVHGHVDFAVELATQMGGFNMAICAPLHRQHPWFMPMQQYNEKVEECLRQLRELLVHPEFLRAKRLHIRAFKILNVFLWYHRKMRGTTQLVGDRVHLTNVGNTWLYHSMRTIIQELARH